MSSGTARPQISHPYPPSYHSSPAQGYSPQIPPAEPFSYGSSNPPYAQSDGYGYSYANAGSTGDLGSLPHQSAGLQTQGYGGERVPSAFSGKGGFGEVPVGGANAEGQAYPPNWTAEDVRAEQEFMKTGLFDWKRMLDWRFWFRKKWWYWYIIIVLCVVLTALMTIYHDEWMKPAATWMKDDRGVQADNSLPAGYTIPVVILFVISFPPLFGHEIVSILVGVVWGLWVGFAIVAVGTFLGEIGNYYAFKYCLRSRAEKIEKKNFSYACLAHVVREGGFFIIFVARLSAIPGYVEPFPLPCGPEDQPPSKGNVKSEQEGDSKADVRHFTTAVFSTCGVGIWIFSIATILTLPKQLVVVYLGVLFGENAGVKSTKDRIISYVLVAVGLIMTVWAAWYIWRQMHKARVVVWRRKRMAEKGLNQTAISDLEEGKSVVVPLSGPIVKKEFPGELGDAEEDEEARSPMIVKGKPGEYASPYGQAYPTREDVGPPIDYSSSRQHINPFESADSLPPPPAFPSAHPSYPYTSDPPRTEAAATAQHSRVQSGSYSTRKPPPPLDFASDRANVIMPVAKPAYHPRKPSQGGGTAF